MATTPFIESQKKLYRQLRPCFCDAIQETVYFNAEGLNYLLYDKHRPRNLKERQYRVGLIQHLVYAISKAEKAKQQIFVKPPCRLWALEWIEVDDEKRGRIKIKVIVRKKGNGNVHFWSVMRRKTKKPGQ